jgi:uncharacterized protein YciI
MTQLFRRSIFTLFALIALAISAGAQTTDTANATKAPKPMKDIRFVVIHTPGSKWIPGKSLFEQVGVREHVDHYMKLLEAGKLALGGPHLDGKAGGMMIPAAGVTEEEIAAFAAADPAVKSGLLLVEIRPWLIGMSQ